MNGKGVVCRVGSRSAVVLTGDLGFVEIRRRPGMEVGQEVWFTGADLVERRRPARLLAIAACLTVLILFSVFAKPWFPPERAVYAYVSVEVNPGVELALDRRLVVVGVRTLNQDGAAVAGDLILEGLPVNEAVAALVQAFGKRGYLGPDSRDLVLTTTVLEAGDGGLLPAELLETVRRTLEEAGGQADVFVLECGPAVRERAREMALSTAHYVIWQKAREEGLAISAADLRGGRLREALALEGRDFGAAVAAAASMRAKVGQERDAETGRPAAGGPPEVRPGVPPGQLRKSAGDSGPPISPGGRLGMPPTLSTDTVDPEASTSPPEDGPSGALRRPDGLRSPDREPGPRVSGSSGRGGENRKEKNDENVAD